MRICQREKCIQSTASESIFYNIYACDYGPISHASGKRKKNDVGKYHIPPCAQQAPVAVETSLSFRVTTDNNINRYRLSLRRKRNVPQSSSIAPSYC